MLDRKNKFNNHHSTQSVKKIKTGEEQTFIKGLALGGHGAMPAAIDVKNSKIVRIRPLHYDWKYERENLNPWKIEARGKVWKLIGKLALLPLVSHIKSASILPIESNTL